MLTDNWQKISNDFAKVRTERKRFCQNKYNESGSWSIDEKHINDFSWAETVYEYNEYT